MFERMEEILKNIDNIRYDINIVLNMSNITILDYIMIKRGSQNMPDHLSLDQLKNIDIEIEKLKKEIDALNKLKRELLVF